MSRKDFQIIAQIVSSVRDYGTRAVLAHDFAIELAKLNSRFDRSRFLKACHVLNE
jgi:hypothetical protein